ncbi:LuxR C-terminal-related transcriptional regulator [Arthrobacter bambusae]|uniref:LuxR C-terminal-related transcriptional regulator n=1 Tax=Arthrobacter bambusae TaxID=1338426 RepID=UPI002784E75D|nr:LuxR C-terminal-related transcriptional regulator [Arthrobacter bambusae]MDQ0029658.1 DNA-binding CsgD family transcriptional regulator/Fe2+ transport system protein FeoA [Arthrobacter bambusae]MDQ0097318.1 DNA-binding CsgD family transcriptional regulator/Fe2+ transport system protein FeoA [Arthrobacter bambusae]
MFDEETRRALAHVARGVSVRIVGGRGSGKSTVLQSIAAGLERAGVTVYSLSGSRLLNETPFAGIGALGLEGRGQENGPIGVANVLAERLARRGRRAIVVDNIDELDKESAAVIDIVQDRTQRPLVVTMDDAPRYSAASVFTPARWPEATIRLSPLHYDQVNKLLAQTLGSPPDVDLTTAVLMKSGGNPRIVVRIAQSAELSGQLVQHGGQWSMSGHTLWNEYLQSTVQTLLHGLSADDWTGLHTLSALGARPLSSLQPIVEASVLDRLETLGLVALTEDSSGAIWVDVTPHIVVDYFRDAHPRSSRRVLADRGNRKIDSGVRSVKGSAPEVLAELITDLRSEAGGGPAATRLFKEQLSNLEESQFRVWESDGTMSAAAGFLKFYWGGPIDSSRIERVFSETDAVGADAGDHFFFGMTQALWAIVNGGPLTAAIGIVEAIGHAHPDWKAETQAFALYLEASFDRMPSNLDETLAAVSSRHPESGVLPVIRGILELYRFDAQAALVALDSANGLEIAAGMEPFVRGLALHIAGRGEEALIFSLSQRAAARRRLDQFGFVANSYVAVLGMAERGLSKEADRVMASVFALGRPGFLANFLHDALLRIAGLRVLASSGKNLHSLGIQARKDVADIGPLPGTGKAVYELVTRKYADPTDFDKKAAELLDQQLERGYVTEAVYASLFMLSLYPGHKILETTQQLLHKHGVHSHAQFLAVAGAIRDRNHQLLKIVLDKYEADSDLPAITRLLKSTSRRYIHTRHHSLAKSLQQITSVFENRFPSQGEQLTLDTGGHPQGLTPREREIAILAGNQRTPEIAALLGISPRTVENHISRALGKTGTTTRQDLYEHARISQTHGE